jgi:hypothetical protein
MFTVKRGANLNYLPVILIISKLLLILSKIQNKFKTQINNFINLLIFFLYKMCVTTLHNPQTVHIFIILLPVTVTAIAVEIL